MSTTEIAVLVAIGLFMIAQQLVARPFGLRMLALPVGFATWITYTYIYGAPTIANDLNLYLIAGAAGAAIGVVGGTLTDVRRDGSRVMVQGSAVYVGLLLALVAGRLAFAWAANNAWRDQVVQFCIDHQITGEAPVAAALMLTLVATVAVRTAVVLVRTARVYAQA